MHLIIFCKEFETFVLCVLYFSQSIHFLLLVWHNCWTILSCAVEHLKREDSLCRHVEKHDNWCVVCIAKPSPGTHLRAPKAAGRFHFLITKRETLRNGVTPGGRRAGLIGIPDQLKSEYLHTCAARARETLLQRLYLTLR